MTINVGRTFGYALLVGLLLLGIAGAGLAWADSPEDGLSALTPNLDASMAAANDHDLAKAEASFRAFSSGWSTVEDGVKAASPESYKAIEDAMLGVSVVLASTPVDANKLLRALQTLDEACDQFISGAYAGGSSGSAVGKPTLESVMSKLDEAVSAIDRGDVQSATKEMAEFRRDWPSVEGLVKAKSPSVYEATENNMAKVVALLTQAVPDAAGAKAALRTMQADLRPMLHADTRYSALDAAMILLREGLEALLVVAGLLAFLKKTGQPKKGRWIWAGSGAGVLISIGIAVVVNVAFVASDFGGKRELLEGGISLFAAAMLIYMSFWLHSKSSLGAWQRYIDEKSSSALARNSVLSLALVAFLAVLREGAETVMFYVGIAPSITVTSLATGLVIGAGALAFVGVLILTFGLRLPLRQFFMVTSILVLYLAFKFTGAGIHSLQVAGSLPATPASYLPSNGFLGLFPTWETTAPQLALALAAGLVVAWPRLRARGRSEEIAR